MIKLCIFLLLVLQIVNSGKVRREIHWAGCPKNAEFRDCTNLCPNPSCDSVLQNFTFPCFSLRCGLPGCVCEDGHVLLNASDHSLGCVTLATCSKVAKLRADSSTTTPPPKNN